MPTVKFVDLGKQYLELRQEILDKFDEISKEGDYVLSKEVSEFEENFAMFGDLMGRAWGSEITLHTLYF